MLPTSGPESKPNEGGSLISATGPVGLVFTVTILLIFLAGDPSSSIAPRREHRPLSRRCIDSAFQQARLTHRGRAATFSNAMARSQ